MLKLNKVARGARTWSAVLANVAKGAYYVASGWKWWGKGGEWLGW